jgi:hypothetical protein
MSSRTIFSVEMTCRLHRQGSDTSELTHRKHRKRQECHLLRSTVVFNGWPTLSTSRHQKRGGRSLELKGLHPAAFWRPFLALSSRQEEIRPGCCRGFPCVKRKDAHHSQAAQRPSGSPDPRRSLVDLLTPTYLPFQDAQADSSSLARRREPHHTWSHRLLPCPVGQHSSSRVRFPVGTGEPNHPFGGPACNYCPLLPNRDPVVFSFPARTCGYSRPLLLSGRPFPLCKVLMPFNS